MNYRLKKYKLKSFDYSKINNKAYIKRYHGRLLSWYMYNEYGLESFIKTLKHYSDRNFFKHLESDFPELIPILESKYDVSINDKSDRQRITNLKQSKNTCKFCNKITSEYNVFCSVKCSNRHKSQDEEFRTKLCSKFSD